MLLLFDYTQNAVLVAKLPMVFLFVKSKEDLSSHEDPLYLFSCLLDI